MISGYNRMSKGGKLYKKITPESASVAIKTVFNRNPIAFRRSLQEMINSDYDSALMREEQSEDMLGHIDMLLKVEFVYSNMNMMIVLVHRDDGVSSYEDTLRKVYPTIENHCSISDSEGGALVRRIYNMNL